MSQVALPVKSCRQQFSGLFVMTEWRFRAACLGKVDLMIDTRRQIEALEVCRGCPVLEPCREFALNDDQLRRLHRENRVWYSVIGGIMPGDLRRHHRAERRLRRSA